MEIQHFYSRKVAQSPKASKQYLLCRVYCGISRFLQLSQKQSKSFTIYMRSIWEIYGPSIPRRVQFAKQSIVIHGWANKHFVEDRQAIEAIHQKMSANYKEGTLKPWDGLNTADSDMTSKEYSNRYFTPIQHANGELSIPFGSNVDPYQHLSRAATSNMVHLPTNEVGYYQYIPIHRRKSGLVWFACCIEYMILT